MEDRNLRLARVRRCVTRGQHRTSDEDDRNKDAGVGESAKANKIIDPAFDLDESGQGQFVVIQSKTKTVDDPAFRATINETVGVLSNFKEVEKLRSPLATGNEGQVSPDRHAALITFSPHGTYDEAALYIDTITAAASAAFREHTPTSTLPRRAFRPRRRSTRSSTPVSLGRG